MDSKEFREFGQASLEFIIKYLETIRERNVLPTTTPHSLIQRLPKEIPEQPEHWKTVLDDLEHIIVPDLAHWQSPHFHAYFPSSSSMGSIIGELLIAGIGALGFSWNVFQKDTISRILNTPGEIIPGEFTFSENNILLF